MFDFGFEEDGVVNGVVESDVGCLGVNDLSFGFCIWLDVDGPDLNGCMWFRCGANI